MSKNGITFNQWNAAYHKYGTAWLEDQLVVLQAAIDNSKQLDEHYATPQRDSTRWNYNGK